MNSTSTPKLSLKLCKETLKNLGVSSGLKAGFDTITKPRRRSPPSRRSPRRFPPRFGRPPFRPAGTTSVTQGRRRLSRGGRRSSLVGSEGAHKRCGVPDEPFNNERRGVLAEAA